MRSNNTGSANRRAPGLVIAAVMVLVGILALGGVVLASSGGQTITPLAAQSVPGDADAPSANNIDLVWSVTNPTISGIGNTTTLDISMVAGAQTMRAFALYLNFPNTIIEAVDFDVDDPDYDIDINMTDFPAILVSRINNPLGRIDAAAGRLTGVRSGTRRLISVTFRGVACGTATVSFAFEPANVRVTSILLDETELLRDAPSNTITVTDATCPVVIGTATNTPTNTPSLVPATATNTPTNTPSLVPATATNTPTNTPSLVPATATSTATNTATLVPATATSTATNTATLVPATATNTPTNTPSLVPATATSTATNTATLVPIETNTPGPTNTPTNTPEPTNTLPPTNTPPPSNTPEPTNTPTDTPPTNTPEPTATIDPSAPTATTPPVVPPGPTPTPVPAAFVACDNLGRRTDGNMTAAGTQGIVTAGGTQRGDAFCRIIAVNGGYVTSPQEVGDRNIVSRNVRNAVDIFGLMPNGARGFNIFTQVMQVCVRSIPGTILVFADALGAPRIYYPAQTFTSGDYTCTYVGRDGTIAQVDPQ